jgi:hypothetical protein
MAAGDDQPLLSSCNTDNPVGAQPVAQNDLHGTVGNTINLFLDERAHPLRDSVQSLIELPNHYTIFFRAKRFQLRLYHAAGHNYTGDFFVSLQYFSTPFRFRILSFTGSMRSHHGPMAIVHHAGSLGGF